MDILIYPDPFLRRQVRAVTVFDGALRSTADAMLKAMYRSKGVGLAAPQVRHDLRLIVVDLSSDQKSPVVLVNPEITRMKGRVVAEEGCLSLPGVMAKVMRAEAIEYRAVDIGGSPIEAGADGLLARALQHEMDHLDGVLFIDKLSPAARIQVKTLLAEMETRSAATASSVSSVDRT